MSTLPLAMNGTIHGNSVEFDQSVDLPEGMKVTVVVSPAGQNGTSSESVPPGLLRAFGAWKEDSEEIEKFQIEYRQLRRGIFPERK